MSFMKLKLKYMYVWIIFDAYCAKMWNFCFTKTTVLNINFGQKNTTKCYSNQ